jgi:hypothetical protein
MTEMWIDLLPVLLAIMISPARTLAVILLLHTPRSTTTALSYVAGMISAMLLQGAGLGAAMSLVGLTSDERSSDLTVFVGALFVVGGLILLAGAFKFATAPTSGDGSLASILDRLEHTEPAGGVQNWIRLALREPQTVGIRANGRRGHIRRGASTSRELGQLRGLHAPRASRLLRDHRRLRHCESEGGPTSRHSVWMD